MKYLINRSSSTSSQPYPPVPNAVIHSIENCFLYSGKTQEYKTWSVEIDNLEKWIIENEEDIIIRPARQGMGFPKITIYDSQVEFNESL